MSGSSKVNVVALKKIGRFAAGDVIKDVGKYEARVLVSIGKAKFENDDDEFRRVIPAKKKKRTRRNEYERRDMVAAE